MTGALSLLKAFEYIENIWGYEIIEKKEAELTQYFLEKVKDFPQIELIGSTKAENRVSVFSFIFEGYHSDDVADYLAENGIAVRSWKQCAHPLFASLNKNHSVRVSMYIYNDIWEIDKLFDLLSKLK
jgi:selenocysteine lyase/cysteine desulfurase